MNDQIKDVKDICIFLCMEGDRIRFSHINLQETMKDK